MSLGSRKLIKKAIKSIFGAKPSDLIAAIDTSDIEVVSFDVFDTLVTRDVRSPIDVFVLLERDFNNQFGLKLPITKMRILAERDARAYSQLEEITLPEIYGYLGNSQNIVDEQLLWLMQHEIELEMTLCTACCGMKEVWDHCTSVGYEVIVCSDMYLDKKIIELLLERSGYTGWRQLYVSSDIGKKKRSGSAFRYVVNNLDKDASKIIHIGDSIIADWLVPRKLGMKSVLLSQDRETKFFNARALKSVNEEERIAYSFVNSFIRNHIPENYNYYEKIGYEAIGPMLYGYSQWLSNSIKRHEVEKVFFLAREGFLLKEAFDDSGFGDEIESEVLRVSRFATAFPRLCECCSFAELTDVVNHARGDIQVGTALKQFGLTEKQVDEIYNATKVQMQELVSSLSEEQQDRLFVSVIKSVHDDSLRQSQCIRKYLSQHGFVGNVAVADIGWLGSIQRNLEKLEPEANMIGLYLGMRQTNKDMTVGTREGFLFDSIFSPIGETVASAMEIFELCFLATEGTTTGYSLMVDGTAVPEIGIPEQDTSTAEMIVSLQRAAIRFVSDFSKHPCAASLDYTAVPAAAAYCRVVDPPTLELVEAFNGFRFSYRSGLRGFLPEERRRKDYLLNPRLFIEDLKSTSSRGPFLKTVFAIPMPYTKISSMLRRLSQM